MNLIFPEIFEQSTRAKAVFTESNRQEIHPDNHIPGLNLGVNTAEDPEIIQRNIKTLFSHLLWDPEKLATAGQVHGTHIQVVDEPGIYSETDGLVTSEPDLVLGIRVADCVAVLIADPIQNVIGAFHAGWKGAADGIVSKGIDHMKILSGKPENFQVFISPCISVKNFEVGDEVAVRFPDEFVDRKSFRKPHVDLNNFILWQLTVNGVPEAHIEISDICTMEDERFYSYRREHNSAGRMLALIKLES